MASNKFIPAFLLYSGAANAFAVRSSASSYLGGPITKAPLAATSRPLKPCMTLATPFTMQDTSHVNANKTTSKKAKRRQLQIISYTAHLDRLRKLEELRNSGEEIVSVRVILPYKIGIIKDEFQQMAKERMTKQKKQMLARSQAIHQEAAGQDVDTAMESFSLRTKKSRVFLPLSAFQDYTSFREELRNELLKILPSLEHDVHYGKVLESIDSFIMNRPNSDQAIEDTDALVKWVNSREIEEEDDEDGAANDRRGSNERLVSLQLIPKNPVKAPTPPKLPQHLRELYDRAENDRKYHSDHLVQTISAYRFMDIENPAQVVNQLRTAWTPYGVRGRIYVAKEGINAQFAVPLITLNEFTEAVAKPYPQLSENASQEERDALYYETPKEIRGIFFNKDTQVSHKESAFEDLRIKERQKVLQDGLDDAVIAQMEWTERNGIEMNAEDWHQHLVEKQQGKSDIVILDCRNKYESEVGIFDGAIPLDTDTFRETWDWLEEQLKDTDKDAKILTYCTGGIRCVKMGAYMEQKMGFKNVYRLKGGIISYSRMLREKQIQDQSTFKGVNFVFDLRIGERLSSDVLAHCDTCGVKCDVQTDCANVKCSRPFNKRLFVQCPECAARMQGCCSPECVEQLQASLKFGSNPPSKIAGLAKKGTLQESIDSSRPIPVHTTSLSTSGAEENASGPNTIYTTSSMTYAESVSNQNDIEDNVLKELAAETQRLLPGRAHMISGQVQGQMLHSLVKMSKAMTVLELGTFTGYSALCMASALPNDSSSRLISVELDREVLDIARSFAAKSAYGNRIEFVEASCMDALKMLHERGMKFDMVFLDANKKQYQEYYDTLLDMDLVRKDGWILADNVLFRGEVEKVASGESDYYLEDEFSDVSALDPEALSLKKQLHIRRSRSMRTARKIAEALHEFNEYVAKDPRTDKVLLPIRDGLTLIRR
eukprot:CAMPEP_0184696960 /NCGR_PEP_ID=MMETSP0313-20130426/4098_1 /TAXON_ID=2792 /ORGANISM="Porphyridium aerugineum, Strain SAG 1380-2" /LENGTH=940 /DNA_ID=CAMNT_0027155719 /DNA_START=149 /DNA_END=2967 /DNA_ORIENTATION=+